MTVTITGVPELRRSLSALQKQLVNDQALIKEGLEVVDKFNEQNFLKQGSPQKWKPLSEKTKRARASGKGHYAKGASGGGGILAWTGNLRDNNTKKVNKGSGEFIKNAPYATYHENGGRNLPVRKVLPTDPRMEKEIVKVMDDVLNKIIVQQGLS